MEHKETPELDAQEIPLEELPVLSESEPASEQESGFVDYFADILPEQPVEEESSLPAQEETTPIVTADTAVLSDIQSAVASILSEEAAWEEAQPERMEEPTAKLDMVSAISSAAEDTALRRFCACTGSGASARIHGGPSARRSPGELSAGSSGR